MVKANKILGATIILMGVTFLSKIISFIREMFIAAQFGTSEQADIFVAVITIPNLLLTIASGALSAALVPLIIKLRNKGEDVRLRSLVGSMFTLTSLLMLGVTILLYFFMKPFADVYVVGFSEEAKLMTIELLKIMLPALIAIGLISLFSAVLNAYHHFFTPSLGPVFYSLGVIIAVIFFADTYGVKSLVIGMAIGIFLQLMLVIAMVLKKGVKLSFGITKDDDLKRVGALILPIFIGVGAFQVNTIVDRMMASTLPSGSLAALNYANKVTQLPLSVFVGSMVLPLFPTIADKIANKDFEGTRVLLARSYHLLGILLLPIIGVFVGLAEPLIAIMFQRGEFDASASQITGLALAFYAFMILPFAMRDLMTRAFYSLQDTWTPVINSVLLVVLNVTLMLIFVPRLGMIAVAGSTSLSGIFGYLRLRSKLIKRIGAIKTKEERKIWLYIWRNALIFTGLSYGGYQLLFLVWNDTIGLDLWLRTFGSLLIAGLVYVYLTLRLDTVEVHWLKDKYKAVIGKIFRR